MIYTASTIIDITNRHQEKTMCLNHKFYVNYKSLMCY